METDRKGQVLRDLTKLTEFWLKSQKHRLKKVSLKRNTYNNDLKLIVKMLSPD